MADPRGFLRHDREVAERRPVDERVHDWQEVYPGGPGRALLPIIATQASRCMDCGIPFCHQRLPARQPDPRAGTTWSAAASGPHAPSHRLHATNNFPEFTGRPLPRPVRGARACSGINHDRRSPSRTSRSRSSTGRGTPATYARDPRSGCPARRWASSAPVPPGSRPRSN